MRLEVKDLHKSFGDKEVLHGISFQVESGKALGLLGRNGAGKTTTIRIIMDVFKANSGEVLLDGKPFNPLSYQIGYLPEERGLYPKREILEQIMYFAGLRGMSRKAAKESALAWLDRLGVGEYAHKKLETLSKGNQQKVQLAQTIVCNPEIVILDEPFSGLDPVNSQILKDVINDLIREGRLVIFSSHQMSYVEEFCDDIVIINKGEVVLDGNLKEIKKEFGCNRISVSAMNYSAAQLEVLCKDKLDRVVTIDAVKKTYVVLELLPGKSKNDLLQALLEQNVDIEKFAMYEPSLTDIFVMKAGDM